MSVTLLQGNFGEDTDPAILMMLPAMIKRTMFTRTAFVTSPLTPALRSSDCYASTSFPIAALSFKRICEP